MIFSKCRVLSLFPFFGSDTCLSAPPQVQVKGIRHGVVHKGLFYHRFYVLDAEGKSIGVTLKSRPPQISNPTVNAFQLEQIAKKVSKTVGQVVVISGLAVQLKKDGEINSITTTKRPVTLTSNLRLMCLRQLPLTSNPRQHASCLSTQFVTPEEHSGNATELAGEFINLLPEELVCTDIGLILEATRVDTPILAVVDTWSLVVKTNDDKKYYEAGASDV